MVSDKNTSSTSSTGLSNNPIEQFLILAKTAKGPAAVELINQVLDTPGIYNFKELIDMSSIKELESNPCYSNYYNLLKLFANGTYQDYLKQKTQLNLPDLSDLQKKKLQNLTIVSLSLKSKCIPYKKLLEELDISNVRNLEDLIIEAIYSDIIHGKLDQTNSCLELDFAIGRDINPGDLTSMIQEFQGWSDACSNVLKSIETQISKANADKNQHIAHSNIIDTEIINIRKTLKTQNQDDDEMFGGNIEQTGDKNKKYKIKVGGNRGGTSTKFWQK